jgi:amino-acid N-acetyltransferase
MRMKPTIKGLAVRTASGFDRESVTGLLTAALLPIPQPQDPPVEFLVAERDGEVVACAGWERYAERALVRSVAVSASSRGSGIGRRLIAELLEHLEAAGVREFWLVTMEAAGFFSQIGFEVAPRSQVPKSVQASPEFAMHCCANGTWMRRG